MNTVKIVLLLSGIVCIGISLVALALGALGILGVVADVSAAENRQIGFGFLRLGLPWLVGGAVLCMIGLLAMRREVGRERDDR